MIRPGRARASLALLTVVLVGALAAGCASTDGTAPAASSAEPPILAGTGWNLTSYVDPDGAVQPAVTEPAVATLAFSDAGGIVGSTGCNRFTGTYTQDGSQLTLAPGGMTMMACVGPAGDQEAVVVKALAEVRSFAALPGSLTLKDAAGADLLVYAPGLASLVGTSWTATGINNGKDAVVSDATTSKVTATFGEANILAGSGGCNEYTSTWVTSGTDTLSIGPVAATERACAQDVMDTEQLYFAALEKVATYQVEGNRLTLRDADGATQVSYVQDAG